MPFMLNGDPRRRGLGSTPERPRKATSAPAAGSATDADDPSHRTTTRRAALAAFPLGNHPLVPMPRAEEGVMIREAKDHSPVSPPRFPPGLGVARAVANTPWPR